MSETNNGTSGEDPSLRRFREYVAAGIAGLVIIGGIVIIMMAFGYVGNGTDGFNNAKDLLLVVNPIIGVVIGYYFNKVSTDARAETAETTAHAATATAQRAEDARERASSEAVQARAQAYQAEARVTEEQTSKQAYKIALTNVAGASRRVLSVTPPRPSTLGAEEGPSASEEDQARAELQFALQQAQPLLT